MTTLPQRYRSKYTGPQIDEFLAGVQHKIDKSIITTDIEEGSPDRVPAASITKNLHERVLLLNDPNYFLQLFLSIPDNNTFTDAYKLKLDNLNTQFKGVFNNDTDRADNLDTSNFLGGELTLVLNDGSGFQRYDFWDNLTAGWKSAKFIKDGSTDPVFVPFAATIRFSAIDITKFSSCKYLITVEVGTAIKTVEVLACSNGLDSFTSISNQVGTTIETWNDLMEISSSLEGTELILNVTTKISDTVVSGKLIAEI